MLARVLSGKDRLIVGTAALLLLLLQLGFVDILNNALVVASSLVLLLLELLLFRVAL